MKTKTQAILIALLTMGLSAEAAEWVTRLNGVIEHRCSIKVTDGTKSVIYQNFSPAVNSFKSLSSYIPATQRYQVDENWSQKSITLNTRSTIQSVGNTYSNCMSLALAKDPVFAQSADAEKYLLKVENGFIDVCWSNYDGAIGISRTITKIGTDQAGKDILTESSDHPLRQLPGVEISIAKRSLINEVSGQRLSLSATDLLTQRGSIFVEGDSSLTRNIGNLTLEVSCSTQERAF